MRASLSCFIFFLTFFELSAQPLAAERVEGIINRAYPSTSDLSKEKARDELLVNTRLFYFDSSHLEPWIEGITHLRCYGVDFKKSKTAAGKYQYADEEHVNDFISFCKEKNLKVIWTLNVSSVTLEQEMDFVASLIDRGLNITGFEYGGEFYLKKYYFGNTNAKGVIERVRMDGEYRDYLDLLEMWLPAMRAEYPLSEYQHIIIAASHGKKNNRRDVYRREFNAKIFDWVENRPEYKGKVDFSYHLYAGAKPDGYPKDEADVLSNDDIDWGFLETIPAGSHWVCTESGYYVQNFSDEEMAKVREFLTQQSEAIGKEGLLGIHTLYKPISHQDNMALYNLNGLTPIGENIQKWLNDSSSSTPASGSNSGGQSNGTQEIDEGSSSSFEGQPTLVEISPEYGGLFDFIHFSHTLTFSNGKSYKRSYWFSKPPFSKDDLGKPLNYFKKKVK